MWLTKNRITKSSLNLPVTNEQRCVSSNAKTLGLKHLQFPDKGASGEPADEAGEVHHWTDELFIRS